jgi:hypothetical protein
MPVFFLLRKLDEMMTDQEAENLIALSVKLGITEYKLRIAYAALKRNGVEMIDITSLDEEPGLSYAICEPYNG